MSKELTRMIEAGRGNQWLVFGKMAVYIRVGKKMINGKLTRCIQIANLGTAPQYQGNGTFTRLLEQIKQTTRSD